MSEWKIVVSHPDGEAHPVMIPFARSAEFLALAVPRAGCIPRHEQRDIARRTPPARPSGSRYARIAPPAAFLDGAQIGAGGHAHKVAGQQWDFGIVRGNGERRDGEVVAVVFSSLAGSSSTISMRSKS